MNAERANAGQKFAAVIVNYNGGKMLSESVRSCLREGIPAADHDALAHTVGAMQIRFEHSPAGMHR